MAPEAKAPQKRERPDEPANGDELFPRGGKSVLTPLEERKLKLRAKADFERESTLAGRPTKKKSRSSAGKADEEGSLFKIKSASGDLPKFVDLLKFSNLTEGGKVWGAVLDVADKRLTVSLPHGLRGTVNAEDASDVLTALMASSPSKSDRQLRAAITGPPPRLSDIFYPGQFVQCSIKSLESAKDSSDGVSKDTDIKAGRKVRLSLCLSDVCAGMDKAAAFVGAALPACIRTVEDHGCSLTLGVPGVSAFLPLADYHAAFGSNVRAVPGQLLQVVIKKLLRGGKDAVVGCEATEIASSMLKPDYAVTHGNLLPGQLVTVTVRAAVSDGLIVTFLKFFHGVIDKFHLPHNQLSSWRTAFTPGMRLKARIIHISTSSKMVRLTLLKNLLEYHLPTVLPTLGSVYEDVTVIRPDNTLGALVKVPISPSPQLGYIHISNLEPKAGAKTVAATVGKEYPTGTVIRAKVNGFRLMDNLITLTARSAAVEAAEVTWDTLQPAMILDGRVHAVEDYGVTVQVTPAIRGLVPLSHATDAGTLKSVHKHFSPGKTVKFRVIEVDAKKKRVLLTLKKGILSAKTPAITHPAAATPGTRTHGWVTGITDIGVFIALYNRLKGLVPTKDIDLSSGSSAKDLYHVGQVVKCTIVRGDTGKGLILSLAGPAAAAAAAEAAVAADSAALAGLEPGSIVQGAVVTAIRRVGEAKSTAGGKSDGSGAGGKAEEESEDEADDDDNHKDDDSASKEGLPAEEIVLELLGPSGDKAVGRLAATHLSDHPHASEVLAGAIRVGSVLPEVLVLECRVRGGFATVSRKPALLRAARDSGLRTGLPKDIGEVKPGMHLTGFVSNITETACFVRFLNHLTGIAGRTQVSDAFVDQVADVMEVGQTVQAVVKDVDEGRRKLSLSLKPSMVTPASADMLSCLYKDLELAAALAEVPTGKDPVIGSLIRVTVKELQSYGIVCDIEGSEDLVGLLTPPHKPVTPLKVGESCSVVVLDVYKLDGIVDLSARADLVEAAEQQPKMTKKSKRKSAEGSSDGSSEKLQEGSEVKCTVELVKNDAQCVVVRVHRADEPLTVGFVSTCDHNVQNGNIKRNFKRGQEISATVAKLPNASETGSMAGRLLLTTSLQPQAGGSSAKRAREEFGVGMVVTGVVETIKAQHVDVKLSPKVTGYLSACDIVDLKTAKVGTKPTSTLTVGQEVKVVVVPAVTHKHRRVMLSCMPSVVAAAEKAAEKAAENLTRTADDVTKDSIAADVTTEQPAKVESFPVGSEVAGVIEKIAKDSVSVALSNSFSAHVYCLHASDLPEAAMALQEHFEVGSVVQGSIIEAHERRTSLSLLPKSFAVLYRGSPGPKEGQLVMAKVQRCGGAGVWATLADGSCTSVQLTDLHDKFVPNALEGLKSEQIVRAKVTKESMSETPRVNANGDAQEQGKKGSGEKAGRKAQGRGKEMERRQVAIRGVTLRQSAGCMHSGHVNKAAGPSTPEWGATVPVEKGQTVHGYVRKVTPAKGKGPGVYLTLSHTQSGRIQLRNLADKFVEDPVTEFPEGKLVAARVLSAEGQRVELTCKAEKREPTAARQKLDSFALGQELNGVVKQAQPYGLFIQLSDSITTGLVHISEVSDKRIYKLEASFPVGRKVRVAVLAVDHDKGRLSLGMKDRYFVETAAGEGEGGEGVDEEMEDVEGSGLADNEATGAAVGDIDIERALLDAYDESDSDDEEEEADGAAESDSDADEDVPIAHVHEADASEDDEEELLEEEGVRAAVRGVASESDDEADEQEDSEAGEGGEGMEGSGSEEEQEDDSEAESEDGGQRMDVDGDPYGWGGLETQQAEDEDTTEVAERPQKSRRQKKREREEAEAEVRKAEKAKLEDAPPGSIDDYERLILGSPNSSRLWIRYMAFLLSMQEVSKAREVAEKALRTIDYRQQEEKFNVWVAFLNLENSFADDPERDAADLLQRALQQNDTKKMYLAALDIFQRSQRISLLQTCAKGVRRKFRESCKVWLRLAQLSMAEGKSTSQLLEDATKSLPKRKHVKFLSRVALMEYKEGTAEKGRGVFENVLLTYPKRTDIWGVYIDQEIKHGQVETVRNLFERTIHLNLKPKKMRYFFKRYVAFESDHGAPDRVEYVKQRALEFIESQSRVAAKEK